MIKFSDLMPVDFLEKTKVKFNMNNADREVPYEFKANGN